MKQLICGFLIFIAFNFSNLIAQNEQINLEKYKFYRQRFNQYFIVVGKHPGESFVIGNRNRYMGSKICFGQQGVIWGYYLGVLSTEYALLMQQKDTLNAQKTLFEIDAAINTYCNQMDKFEHIYGIEDKLDGCFIRENVPLSFLKDTNSQGISHQKILNQNLDSSHIFLTDSGYFRGLPKGMPAYIDGLFQVYAQKEMMSQDEAYGIMMGFALLAKCVPERQEIAKHLFEIITLHIIGKNQQNRCSNDGYIIKGPTCEIISESTGGNTSFFAYGIAAAAAAVTEKSIDNFINKFSSKDYANSLKQYSKNGKFRIPIGINNMYYIWKICGNGIPGNQEWNRSMACTLGAIGDSWGKNTEKHIIKNCYWTKGSKQHDWRTFYVSLWRFLHDKIGNDNERQAINAELNTAPQYGPYNYKSATFPDNFSKGGWAYTYRYRATFSEQFEGSNLTGNFSGLDYMLMYNLYQLLYASSYADIPKYTVH